MPTYLLDLPLDKHWDGLHCTLMGYFITPHKTREIIDTLSPLFSRWMPLVVRSVQPDWFGPRGTVHVDRITGGEALVVLHRQVYADVRKHLSNDIPQPEWVGLGYKPHVTRIPPLHFATGAETTLRTVRLREAGATSDDPKPVRHVWQLGH